MKVLLLVLAAICLQFIALAKCADVIPFSKSVQKFLSCPCKDPQPRLVHLDELPDLCKTNVRYTPMAVLIHRCERSVGHCRRDGEICTFGEQEEVQFQVEESSSAGKPKVIVSLTNHTRCECSSPAADSHRA